MWHGKSQASSASAPALPPTYFSSMSLFGRNCLQDSLILLPVLNKDMSRTFAIISYLSVHDWERSKYSTIWIFSGNHHQNTAIEELLEMQLFIAEFAYFTTKWIQQHPQKPLLQPDCAISTIDICNSSNSSKF